MAIMPKKVLTVGGEKGIIKKFFKKRPTRLGGGRRTKIFSGFFSLLVFFFKYFYDSVVFFRSLVKQYRLKFYLFELLSYIFYFSAARV